MAFWSSGARRQQIYFCRHQNLVCALSQIHILAADFVDQGFTYLGLQYLQILVFAGISASIVYEGVLEYAVSA